MENKKPFDKNEYTKNYNKEKYKQLKAEISPDDYYLIDEQSKKLNISKAKFIVAAIKYCIDNNIKFED